MIVPLVSIQMFIFTLQLNHLLTSITLFLCKTNKTERVDD